MDKPCICTLCDTAFRQVEELINHVMMNHVEADDNAAADVNKIQNNFYQVQPRQPSFNQFNMNYNPTVGHYSQGGYQSLWTVPTLHVPYGADESWFLRRPRNENKGNQFGCSPTSRVMKRSANDRDMRREKNPKNNGAKLKVASKGSKATVDQVQIVKRKEVDDQEFDKNKDDRHNVSKDDPNTHHGQKQDGSRNADKKDLGRNKASKDDQNTNVEEENGKDDDFMVECEDMCFVSAMCDKLFDKERDLKIHLLSHDKSDWFSCESCGKDFLGEQFLLRHKRNCPDFSTKQEADIYGNRNCQAKDIFTKQKTGTNCPSFPSKNEAVTKDKTSPLRVKIRFLDSKAPSNGENAAATTTTSQLQKFCNNVFSASDEMLDQVREHMGSKTPHECAWCGKIFADRCRLVSHERTHTGEKPYHCDTCGKRFSQKSSLGRHKKTHNVCKPFQCGFCSKSFADKSNCSRHERGHVEQPKQSMQKTKVVEPEVEAVQPKQSTKKTKVVELEPELLRELKEKSLKHLECILCEKEFPSKTEIDRHWVVHTGEKPFKCNFCEKAFNERGNRRRHERIHTGEKPYKCDVCGKDFTYIYNLKSHRKRIHWEQEYREAANMLVNSTSDENRTTSVDQP